MEFKIIASHHLKDDDIHKYHTGDIFIETGTYKGDGVDHALYNGFKQIYSCELNNHLYQMALVKFHGMNNVFISNMDSVDFLDYLAPRIDEPVTFWLDAHRSGPLPGGAHGDCPLVSELEAIAKFKRNDHTIFIDNKALFGSEEWGGVTEQSVLDAIKKINPDYQIEYLEGVLPGDIICAHTQTISET